MQTKVSQEMRGSRGIRERFPEHQPGVSQAGDSWHAELGCEAMWWGRFLVAGQVCVEALCWLVSQVLQLHLMMQQVCFLTRDPIGLTQLFCRSSICQLLHFTWFLRACGDTTVLCHRCSSTHTVGGTTGRASCLLRACKVCKVWDPSV